MLSSQEGEAWLQAVGRAVETQDVAGATRLAREALVRGLEDPLLLTLRANEHREAGRLAESLSDLRRAHLLAPREVTILDSTGLTLLEMDKGEEALKCYDLALAIDPTFDVGWVNRGWALQWLGRGAAASESYERALQINPQNAHGLARLAALINKRGDRTRALALAERAHVLLPGKPDAELILAEIGLSDPATTEWRLRNMLERDLNPKQRAHALSLLADALDSLDRPAEAFAAYVEANEQFRESNSELFGAPDGPSMTKALEMLNSWVEDLDPSEWVDDRGDGAGEASETGHVFLMGFSRSGTTLIESVLAVHPEVVHLEERDTLRGAAVAFLDRQKDLANLTRISRRALQGLRDDYWSRVHEYGVDPTGKVFIDKGPFNTPRLGLIRRLFPKAKILFALRDPRDVVLSSFRRRFRMNHTTFSLLDLVECAEFYAATMQFADTFRRKVPLDEYLLRYENLIADFHAEARAVCDFIGVPWRDDLIDFANRAKSGGVNSASSEQISRGLYTDQTSHWRRYREQLTPVMPILQPWVERYGYPAE